MFKYLKTHPSYSEIVLLFLMGIFCFSLSVLRILFSETTDFLFLNWNLFLASIPWFVSTFFMNQDSRKLKKISLLALLSFWILFFPNAPYILTDLFHLKQRVPIPIWFDLILILSFAWTGLIIGYLSLIKIEQELVHVLDKQKSSYLIIALLFLTGFGIYIGRYLRWNSWDLLHNPTQLIADIFDRVVDPLHHPRTWAFTIFMGIFLNLSYKSLKLFQIPRAKGTST